MFDTQNTKPAVIDILQIEADARRMRAEFIGSGVRAAARWIVSVLTVRPSARTQH